MEIKAEIRSDCFDQCSLAAGCPPLRDALCRRMSRIHAEKTYICDELEAIADSLPYQVDRLKCLGVANRLIPILRDAHRYEEEVLFPAFERDSASRAVRIATVRRLKSEHVCDEGAADEITEELMRIGHGGDIDNPEALGFMLRAFFVTVRRHMAFEAEHIFPATRSALASLAGET